MVRLDPRAKDWLAENTTTVLEHCLEQLQLEYVDLMLLHSPASWPGGRQEQWRALEAWARQGKARAIGVSQYNPIQMADLLGGAATLPVALNQFQSHVGRFNDQESLYMSYAPLCESCEPPTNMELITGEQREVAGWINAWADPLRCPSESVRDCMAISPTSAGKAHNKTGAQMALRWLLEQQPNVLVQRYTIG